MMILHQWYPEWPEQGQGQVKFIFYFKLIERESFYICREFKWSQVLSDGSLPHLTNSLISSSTTCSDWCFFYTVHVVMLCGLCSNQSFAWNQYHLSLKLSLTSIYKFTLLPPKHLHNLFHFLNEQPPRPSPPPTPGSKNFSARGTVFVVIFFFLPSPESKLQ